MDTKKAIFIFAFVGLFALAAGGFLFTTVQAEHAGCGGVRLNASPSAGGNPLSTTLTADASRYIACAVDEHNAELVAATYRFKTGDGRTKTFRTKSTTQSISHTYEGAGSYTASVTVTVEGDQGNKLIATLGSDSDTATVWVLAMDASTPSGSTGDWEVGTSRTFSSSFTWDGDSATGELWLVKSNTVVQDASATLSGSPQSISASFSPSSAGTYKVCAYGVARALGYSVDDIACTGNITVEKPPVGVNVTVGGGRKKVTITAGESTSIEWKTENVSEEEGCTTFASGPAPIPGWPGGERREPAPNGKSTGSGTLNTVGIYRPGLTCNPSSSAEIEVIASEEPAEEESSPVANAGSGHSLTVDSSHGHWGASARDDDGDLSRFRWSWVSCPTSCPLLSVADGTLSGSFDTIPGPHYKPRAAGSHTLRLMVTDENGNAGTDTLTEFASEPAEEESFSVNLRAKQGGNTWFESLSGEAPFENIDLRADPSRTPSGNTDYTFYCDRSDSGTNITEPWDARFTDIEGPRLIVGNLCRYPDGGSYSAKVIAERGGFSAEDRVPITVSEPGNTAPSAQNLQVNEGSACTAPLQPTLSWTFSDTDGDPQTAYQVQMREPGSGWGTTVNTGKINSSSESYTVPASKLDFDTTYEWRIKVWDDNDTASEWAEGSNFTTQEHAAPDPDFTWSPDEPPAGEEIPFTDESTAYGGASIASWSWTFQDATPSSSSEQNPAAIVFGSTGDKTVSLTVDDSDGFQCTTEKNVPVTASIPDFEEVSP